MRTYRHHDDHTQAFAEVELSELLRVRLDQMKQAIQGESDTYLLSVNRDDYLKHVVAKYEVAPLVVDFDGMKISPEEMLIPAELYPSNFTVYAGKSYPRLVITYHLSVSGDASLFKARPSTYSLSNPSIRIERDEIQFTFIPFDSDPETTKREANGTLDSLKQGVARINADLENFNQSLPRHSAQVFDSRKQQLLERQNFLAALAVPIKNTQKTAATFAVTTPKRIVPITPRPNVADKTYRAEPTLDEKNFAEILRLIFNVGITFEKLPSTYGGKDEESLRDHFLLALAPNFEGAATGETFNKTGKTDILLQHHGKNLFVAECKFWRGPKSFLDTISQLLGYLTWRDSKAAVIVFVRDIAMSHVLGASKDSILAHTNYLGINSPTEETWLNYRFHLNGDRNREVKLAVMLFHIPDVTRA